jgi:hypothetical protein
VTAGRGGEPYGRLLHPALRRETRRPCAGRARPRTIRVEFEPKLASLAVLARPPMQPTGSKGTTNPSKSTS